MTTWTKAQILLIGTILTPGKRVMTEALRVMGLSESRQFAQYHQVLTRAVWSPLALAGIWRRPVIYHDPVRSSESHFVKASGLRWISLMLLTPIPWAQRLWALPVMTVLAPSEGYYQARKRQLQTMSARSVQMLKLLRRWLPERALVVVGDSAYAALDFLNTMRQLKLTFVTRLRLDAALYEPAPSYSGKGRPRKKGKRLPTLKQVLHNTNTVWTTVSLAWYDGQVRDMQITSTCHLVSLW